MWSCKKCREQHEDSFLVCWSCGTTRDGVEDPAFGLEDGPEVIEAERMPASRRSVHSAWPPLDASQRLTDSVCPKCTAQKMIPEVTVIDSNGSSSDNLTVRLDRNPQAWVFKNPAFQELKAKVCGACGYTELYVTDPAALWSAYLIQRDG
ncbi:MAG: hypothetical protein Q8M16_24395 [Pirellulaceae bacterium]|nr:hypothetical protein [Pirellulaceae bacterium]